MWELILANLVMVLWFMLAAALTVLSSLCSSTYNSVFKFEEKFNFWYFLRGILKSIVFLSSFLWFTSAVTMIPILLTEYGLLSMEMAEIVNIMVAVVVLVKVATKQLSKTYENWKIAFELDDLEVQMLKEERIEQTQEEQMYE